MTQMTTSKSVPCNMNESADEGLGVGSMSASPEPMVTIQIEGAAGADAEGMGDRKKSLRTIFRGAVGEFGEVSAMLN